MKKTKGPADCWPVKRAAVEYKNNMACEHAMFKQEGDLATVPNLVSKLIVALKSEIKFDIYE